MLAARSGRVDAVRALLDGGADLNAREDARGTTALMQAADQGHADVGRADRGRCRCRCGVQAGLARRTHGRARQVRRSAQCRAPAGDSDYLRAGLSRSRAGSRSLSGNHRRCRGRGSRRGAVGAKRRPLQHPTRWLGVRLYQRQAQPAGEGARRWRAHTARVRGPRRQHRRCARAARRRRRRESSYPLRLEPAARSHAESKLSDGEVPHRAWRRRQYRQQGRLDAAVSRDG